MSVSAAVNILHRTAAFGSLSDDRLNVLAFSGERRQFVAGDILAEAGAEPPCCLVVLDGEVVVLDQSGRPVGKLLGRGATIGEIPLITNQPGEFTVTGESAGEVLVITRPLFERMIEDFPDIALNLRNAMRMRLGATLKQLHAIEERLRVPGDTAGNRTLPAPARDQTASASPGPRQQR